MGVVLLLLAVVQLLMATSVHAVCSEQTNMPLRHSGYVLSGDGYDSTQQLCPTDEQKTSAIHSINEEINVQIDSILPQLQASLAPSPCEGIGWTKVVFLDMRNASHNCPGEWVPYTSETAIPQKRLCRRESPTTMSPTCRSALFSTNGLKYSKVCGRVRGYQYSSTEAFDQSIANPTTTNIDIAYMDGVSITRGQLPREHIWSLASGYDEKSILNWVCPCANMDVSQLESNRPPPFVGQNYFCESGTERFNGGDVVAYYDDPLWDGQGCSSRLQSTCCEHSPYFSASLAQASCDDLEVRICCNAEEEDVLVELVELYVK